MGKPNRSRRNKHKADQFKAAKVKATRRRGLTGTGATPVETISEEDKLKALIEERTGLLLKIFDRMEREKLDEGDMKIVATFATKDGLISYAKNREITDLSDLKVEELTQFEFNSILTRANRAINIITQTRQNYSAGPYYTNRGMRQAQYTRARQSKGIKLREPSSAKGIVAAMKAKKAARAATGM